MEGENGPSGAGPRPELTEAGQMDELTVTLKANGGKAASRGLTSPSHNHSTITGIMKFNYASGSRPLDGYTIKRGIGIGGFGEVYFATSDAGKEVALKHIQRNLDIELRGVSQCLNLKHPNLISLYNIRYDDQDNGWVVMEYVAGESLKDAIDNHPQGMPLDHVQCWLQGISAGTAYLHDHGIVHRDLKPGNIFLDEGAVKIGDYGLSKFISVSRRSGQTESVGTFHYMAPEIGKGTYGKEIDIYALGVILFEMLTGRVPFDGESSQEIMMKHLTDEPDLTNIVEPYRTVLAKALAKDPGIRYSNVTELADSLKLDISTTSFVPTTSPQTIVDAEIADSQPDTFYSSDEQDDPKIAMGPIQEHTHPASGADSSVPPTNREPIADAVRYGWQRTQTWWRNAKLYTPLKVLLLILAALIMVGNAGWLLPLTVVVILFYLGYLGLRGIVLDRPTTNSAEHVKLETHGDTQHAHKQRGRTSRKEAVRQAIRSKPKRLRTAELIGSLLMSSLVIAVLGVVSLIVANQDLSGNVVSWAPTYAWLTLTCITGTWAVLCLSKAWEGYRPDHALRRFGMLVVGLVVGAASFGLSEMLLVPHTYFLVEKTTVGTGWPESMYLDGEPQFLAYLGFFAGLFVVLRLWKQTDPLRPTRLSLWATSVFVMWALILQMVCLPFPLGFVIAAMISVALQLSAPWIEPFERDRIRREAR